LKEEGMNEIDNMTKKSCSKRKREEEQPLYDASIEDMKYLVTQFGVEPSRFVSLVEWYSLDDRIIWKVTSDHGTWEELQRNITPIKAMPKRLDFIQIQ
jgi:hypothetical protein